MTVEAALAFLKKVENDSEFRTKVLAISQEPAFAPQQKGEQEQQRSALLKEHGFEFSKDELFEAVGMPLVPLDHEAEQQLRALDEQLRSKGLQGINPLAYTAYSLGIN
jgi:predicted ribosomally synthesized peptide with nif11-like leader